MQFCHALKNTKEVKTRNEPYTAAFKETVKKDICLKHKDLPKQKSIWYMVLSSIWNNIKLNA